MIQQNTLASEEEMRILEELKPEEIFILGFLKGFNRQNMKMWVDMELSIFADDDVSYDEF